jgi:hypothetical protein
MARAILTAPMLVRATMVGLATTGSGGRSSVIEVMDPLFSLHGSKRPERRNIGLSQESVGNGPAYLIEPQFNVEI